MKIILHIGFIKTGTSSLQYFLHKNQNNLADIKIIYAPSILNFGAWLHQFTNSNQETFKRELSLLRQHIESVSENNYYIISCEDICFWSEDDIRLFSQYFSEYPIDVFVYIRRQDDLLDSSYKQLIKGNPFVLKYDTTLYMKEYDYSLLVKRWEQNIKNCNIIIRRYDNNDIIRDFLAHYAINIDCEHAERRNVSPSRDALELIARIKCMRYFDYETIERFIPELHQEAENFQNTRIYSLQERRQFMEHYKESNREIAQRFFNGEELFPPLPDTEPDKEIFPSLTAKKTVNLLKDILFIHLEKSSSVRMLANYIKASGLFDEDYYKNTYLQEETSCSPVEHFVRQGMYREYRPSENFSPEKFLAAYPCFKGSGIPSFLAFLILNQVRSDPQQNRAPGSTSRQTAAHDKNNL